MSDENTPEAQARADTLEKAEAWSHIPRPPWKRTIEVTLHEADIHALAKFISGQPGRMMEGDALLLLLRAQLIATGDLSPGSEIWGGPVGSKRTRRR